MVGTVIAIPDRFGDIMDGDVSKVVDKPVFESKFGLSYILDATDLTCDGIYQIGTTAGYIGHGAMYRACHFAGK